MATRKARTVITIATASLMLVLSGCSGSSPNGGSGVPPLPNISIAFQPTPPSSMVISGSTTVTAAVSNDSADSGVDWLLNCNTTSTANLACGSITAPNGTKPTIVGNRIQVHTPSGTAVTYAAPPTISGTSSIAVSLTAFSTTDPSKNVAANISIRGMNTALKGTYVFQARGLSYNYYQLAGVLVADGAGNITGGELTYGTSSSAAKTDPFTGTYAIGIDGRGSITLASTNGDLNFGAGGMGLFDFVVLSSTQALITETDNTTAASGTMDLQTSTTAPSGGYAFVASGGDVSTLSLALGGVMNIDSPAGISGNGSVADDDDNGVVTNRSTLSGTVSTPDSFGAVTINLTAGFTTTPLQFTGYIVDSSHIKLVESDIVMDPITGSLSGFGSTAGIAIAQAGTGKFSQPKAFSGNFVYGINSVVDQTGSLFLPATWVVEFTANGSGKLTSGYLEENVPGPSGSPLTVSASLTGSYSVDSTGTGRVTAKTQLQGNGAGPKLIFYLTGQNSPALVLDVDSSSQGTGIAYPQTVPASFDGNYGAYFTVNNGVEYDGVAQFSANAAAGTLSGNGTFAGDSNVGGNGDTPVGLSGTFAPSTSPGRLIGTLSGQDSNTPPNPLLFTNNSVSFYLIDSSHGFFIENDGVQAALGYFATQTPVTQLTHSTTQEHSRPYRRRQN